MQPLIIACSGYSVVETKDGGQSFLAAVSDRLWGPVCQEFQWSDLASDARLGTNNARAQERTWLLPLLRERFGAHTKAELAARFERIGLPYAPITRPQELFDDPHLQASGGLASIEVPADASCAEQPFSTQVPLLPLSLNNERLPLRRGPPSIGADTRAILNSVGYTDDEIGRLQTKGVIRSQEGGDGKQAD